MFLRKLSVLAFSAFSLLSSVHTPRTLQSAEVVPVFPWNPVCWWDDYESEVLPFTPANAFANGSIVLAQGPHPRPPFASPNIAGFDLASLEEVEGMFTIIVALARFIKHKTSVVWSKLTISLLVLSGMLALDALQLGEPGFLLAVLHCLPAEILFAKPRHFWAMLRSSKEAYSV
ncbi:hypothetical protein FB45DRAFT_1075882 [Roridomyces roridus]|uniref:Uncharacterized protein n=1 Tax=Roridomyces roridus TaxID=1738132 RepID=A0AAD7CIJ8_9AGAR|nr:hypothetical protein FB45DRAFT_1075882 [Roridomyces roridus]